LDRTFIDEGFEPATLIQIKLALATLAVSEVFTKFCAEQEARLSVGDPDEDEQELLAQIRDIRRQAQIYRGLHELGLAFSKELRHDDS
jgi:hypothetical protein